MSLMGTWQTVWSVGTDKPFKGLPKEYKKWMKIALRGTMKHWHTWMLERHFTPNAVQRYHYQARTPGYRKKKRYRQGHSIPLYWSGTAFKELSKPPKITGTSKSARVHMQGPPYIGWRKHGENSPDMKAEITQITKEEAMELALYARKAVMKAYKHYKKMEKHVKVG